MSPRHRCAQCSHSLPTLHLHDPETGVMPRVSRIPIGYTAQRLLRRHSLLYRAAVRRVVRRHEILRPRHLRSLDENMSMLGALEQLTRDLSRETVRRFPRAW